MTLPSDSSCDIYPENTTAHYRVELPKPLVFEGPYEVGLTGFSYPRTWYNMASEDVYRATFSSANGSIPSRTKSVSPGHYSKIREILDILNPKAPTDLPVYFKYSKFTQKVSLFCSADLPEGDTAHIDLSKRLAIKLGWGGESIRIILHANQTRVAPYVAVLDTVDLIYVNCDLASDSHVVGDKMVPLLKTISVSGSHGDIISYEPRIIDWLPLRNNHIKTVRVLITDSEGRPVPFERGHLTVKVHIRRARPF